MKKNLLKNCSCIDIKIILILLVVLIGGFIMYDKDDEDCNCN